MQTTNRRTAPVLLSVILAAVLALAFSTPLRAQTFASVPAISFTKPFAGADPLPQIVTIANVGAPFGFSVTSSTATGGNWLSVNPGPGCCRTTPSPITATVTSLPTLAVGTYSGQIVVTSQNLAATLTIPVTLTVAATASPLLDNLPGQMSFSLKTGGAVVTSQDVQVRNAGAGSLNWGLATSTSDGGHWLTISASGGTAPSTVTVGVTVANLPGGGLTAGTFVGQLAFSGGGTTATVPVSVVVGVNILSQVNPINFNKVFAGANPLPQVLMIPSIGTNFGFFVTSSTATGGAWLSVSPGPGCCVTTPNVVTASIVASPTLAAGTYTGQIVVEMQSLAMAITIPVTLTVESGTSPFFDNLPGHMSFSMATGGTTVTSQVVEVRNPVSGLLSWSLAAHTSDASPWLTVSPSSGTAPSIVTVGVTPALLPSGGLIAGTFIGELVFDTATGGRVTVPVSIVVGTNILSQVSAINFTKVFAGANPLPQTLTVPSTGTNFGFYVTSSTATGGAWLSVTPGPGCCVTTPNVITATVNASPTLAVGTYTAQIVVTAQSGAMSTTIPVTLTVAPGNLPYFDNVPGQMSFSLVTGSANNPPAQVVQIRNAGPGSLGWTLAASTSDGGDWLHASASSGTAPSDVSITVQKANLPGAGLIAGTFVGELVFRTSGSSVTVPVTFVVGANILSQVNAINFVKFFAGPNPLPQTVTVPSTGTNFGFYVTSATATGGSWLTVTPGPGCCVTTPHTITATVNASPTLAAGTYTAQIVATAQSGDMSITIPVTLTVAPAGSTFFDNLPGQVSFLFQTGSGNPAAQNIQIRNGGLGALNWTLTKSTSDGGNWLTVSAASGTAPSTVAIGVVAGALPGAGLVAGTFVGELVFEGAGMSITIPVAVYVGSPIFVQASPLNFTKAFGAANPLPQGAFIASTGTNFGYFVTSATGNGGAWLSVSPGPGCCVVTPSTVTASIVASPTLPAGTYTAQIVVTSQSSAMAMTIPVTLTVTGQVVPALQFYPIAPCRIADTRSFTGPPGPLGPPSMVSGATRSFPVLSSACGIPASAVAYSLNVAAVPLTNYLGYVTVWGTGQPMPVASTLNSWDGRLVANAAIIPAGTAGAISIFVSDSTDIFFDINGYFAPPGAGSLEFYPLAPCRIADTRSFTGPPGPLGPPSMTAGSTRSFPVLSSACGVPASAVAYSLNVSAVPSTHYLGYLTTWGTGQPQPIASTLNSWTGTIVANAAIVPAGTAGAISIFVSDPTDVFFDINGYFAPPGTGGLQYKTLSPCRVADTRSFTGPPGPLGPPSMTAGSSRSFPVLSSACGIPATATVYAFNMTAVPLTSYLGYLTTWGTGQPQPIASTLNSWTGTIVPNAAFVPAGTAGAISVFVSDPTDVFFDINGYFAP